MVIMDKRLSKKLKLSPFVHFFIKNNKVAIYNSLNHKVFYGDKDLLVFLKRFENFNSFSNSDLKYINKFYNADILVSKEFDKEKIFQKIRKFTDKPKINSLYIITTDKCNYACKYCFVEGNMPSEYKFTMMNEDILQKGIDLFVKSLPKENKKAEVIFYGGEPLLNFEIIKMGISLLDRKVETGNITELNKMIFTNGSLVTRGIAKFFHENRINVGFSLDGYKDIHDKMRVYPSGKGTFEDTIRGYNYLKDEGCHIGISCTVSSHNIDVLDKVIEYFATKLGAKFMSLNPLFDIKCEDKLTNKFLNHMAEKIIESYDIAKKYEVYEDRITKFIEPFVKGYIRPVDCAGCGRQIVLSPDGQIGVCHAFLGNKKFFCGSVYDKNFDPNRDKTFIEWSRRALLLNSILLLKSDFCS